jgi:hypothetical protein
LREHGLKGVPNADDLALLCVDFAVRAGAGLILVDGPQAWRAAFSEFEHMRACERCTRTPGKTGIPEVVKPTPFKRMVLFSIGFFDRLDEIDWPRFLGRWPMTRAAIDTFPTHAWRNLEYRPLLAKNSRSPDLSEWIDFLSKVTGLRWPRLPSHDEIQAVVAGLGGLALEYSRVSACEIHGHVPFREEGSWREVYILSPKNPKAVNTQISACACHCGRSV